MDKQHRQLLESWDLNATAWITAVREGHIESRRACTDQALLATLLALPSQRFLDLGCGEGWLCRALAAHGKQVVGLDASRALIAAASALGGAQYHCCTYEQLESLLNKLSLFDSVVCNFSLLDAKLDPLLRLLHKALHATGTLVIQTLHPEAGGQAQLDEDGWRIETFEGLATGFATPMPWFFRTVESWLSTLQRTGWEVIQQQEPLHPTSGRPLSLLWVAKARSD